MQGNTASNRKKKERKTGDLVVQKQKLPLMEKRNKSGRADSLPKLCKFIIPICIDLYTSPNYTAMECA